MDSPHTATFLDNNNVLIIGGDKVYMFNPADNTFSDITGVSGSLPRIGHTATLLDDDKVLIVGGYSPGSDPDIAIIMAAGILDLGSVPRTFGDITNLATMIYPRWGHTANLLTGEKVLILGCVETVLGSGSCFEAAVYDSSVGAFDWLYYSPGNLYRENHASSMLVDGTVLITGGWLYTLPGVSFIAQQQIYNPGTNSFIGTGSMVGVGTRADHTSTRLNDGSVLVVGGVNALDLLATAEIYSAGSFVSTGSMAIERRYHTATLLQGGKVLITGGQSWYGALGYAEIYDPALGGFSANN